MPNKILELKPKSDLVKRLGERLKTDDKDPLLPVLIEQAFENDLLAEGLHPILPR